MPSRRSIARCAARASRCIAPGSRRSAPLLTPSRRSIPNCWCMLPAARTCAVSLRCAIRWRPRFPSSQYRTRSMRRESPKRCSSGPGTSFHSRTLRG
ncbi:hypothetical protein FVP46_09845 [Mycobacterium tuberculosis]|nr:hypothetical protein [Mycobacterium tuberculosis]